MPSDEIGTLLSRMHICRYGDIIESGFNHRQLRRALDDGLVISPVLRRSLGPVPTIYVSPELDADPDRDDVIATFLSGGVIGLRTAALRHHLNTFLPRTIDVWVDWSRKSRISPAANVTLHRTRKLDLLSIGVEQRDTEFGLQVRITSPARTIVDLFEAGRANPEDARMALQSVSTFLSNGEEPSEVIGIAQSLGLDDDERISVAVNAVHEGMSGGMRP